MIQMKGESEKIRSLNTANKSVTNQLKHAPKMTMAHSTIDWDSSETERLKIGWLEFIHQKPVTPS